jgi:hypothetical protein
MSPESVLALRGQGLQGGLTVSLLSCSDNFLPTSLLVHSSVLLSPELPISPGTTRGILVFWNCRWDLVKLFLSDMISVVLGVRGLAI